MSGPVSWLLGSWWLLGGDWGTGNRRFCWVHLCLWFVLIIFHRCQTYSLVVLTIIFWLIWRRLLRGILLESVNWLSQCPNFFALNQSKWYHWLARIGQIFAHIHRTFYYWRLMQQLLSFKICYVDLQVRQEEDLQRLQQSVSNFLLEYLPWSK